MLVRLVAGSWISSTSSEGDDDRNHNLDGHDRSLPLSSDRAGGTDADEDSFDLTWEYALQPDIEQPVRRFLATRARRPARLPRPMSGTTWLGSLPRSSPALRCRRSWPGCWPSMSGPERAGWSLLGRLCRWDRGVGRRDSRRRGTRV